MENYHFTFTDGSWKFKKVKSKCSIKNFETKEKGNEFVKDFMKNNGGSFSEL
jgi:hypothetical protein